MIWKLLVLLVAFSFFHPQTSDQPIPKLAIDEAGTLSYTELGRIVGNQIIIEHDVDLEGKTCRLPKGFLLQIQAGIIKNGILLGNQTKLSCKSLAFKNISIKGSWDVPWISTAFFADLGKVNSLKNVFALANPDVKNTIIIEKGEYLVKAFKDADVCLSLTDNTDLFLYGTIRIVSNNFKSYNILQAGGDNITIEGKGTIIGDRYSHKGQEGEWGMGVNVRGAKNVTIKNLTIRECWGDCVYIGGNSKNTRIEDCILDDSRRQGISITNADGITIRKCMISNIHGTNPQYAIDIEPNKKCSVNHVLIENTEVINCEGGIRATLPNKGIGNAMVGRIEIRNCRVSANTKYPIHLNRCQQAIVERCTIDATNERPSIYANYIDDLKVCNNTLNVKVQLLSSFVNKARELLGKSEYSAIRVVHTSARNIDNNKIIEE